MESTAASVQAKRGCLWYVGMAIVAVLGGLGLLIAALIFAPDEPGSGAILVSGPEQTYVEAVTKQRAEGFLDPYTVLAVYYTRVGGWFHPTQRVQVWCGGHNTSSYGIGFRRRQGPQGQLQIEVKRRRAYEEIRSALTQELLTRHVWQQLNSSTGQPPTVAEVRALEARAKALEMAGDSVVLTVFTPPATFPETTPLTTYNYDCRDD